jgi:hypothetical protein
MHKQVLFLIFVTCVFVGVVLVWELLPLYIIDVGEVIVGVWIRYNAGAITEMAVGGAEYIAPRDSLVMKYAGRHPARPTMRDIPALRSTWEFVVERSRFITYEVPDVWAHPREMISHFEERGYFLGDCEDYSFLFASLFRAGGVAPDRVRVVVGRINGRGHMMAQIKIIRDNVEFWLPLEPTAGSFYEYAFRRHPMADAEIVAWSDKLVWRFS